MESHTPKQRSAPSSSMLDSLRKFQLLRNFNGEASKFWPLYLDALMDPIHATAGVICLLDEKKEWRTLAFSPQTAGFETYIRLFLANIQTVAERCQGSGHAIINTPDAVIVACPLVVDSKGVCLFMGYLPHSAEPVGTHAVELLKASSDLYAQFRIRKTVADSVNIRKHLANVLEVSAQLNTQTRFMPAAMTLLNELSARQGCDRVSLGWIKGGYVRIQAISHSDGFEKKMEVVRSLEDAMEEAVDQDADLVFPLEENSRLVARAHETYARATDAPFLLSAVLRVAGEPVAICTFERSKTPFIEDDVKMVRIALDQSARRLADLHALDRWFGARWAKSWRRGLSKLFGIEHTWAKILSVLGILLALFATLVPVSYRVDAPMILRTDQVLYLTAPFSGYIDSVSVRPGDVLVKGQELMRLDRNQLLLQEADLQAESRNYEREIQKAQANEELAQIRINTAKLDQTIAKLNTVRFQLEQSIIRSPFDQAVVIEGDLAKKTGAPVQQGGELFRIAMIQNTYAEINVDEEEIKNVLLGKTGQIALKTKPESGYSIHVTRINPAALIKEQANVFQVRAEFVRGVPPWFRPGMTGVAKIDAGDRTLWWIISHRTIDFLQLKLWW